MSSTVPAQIIKFMLRTAGSDKRQHLHTATVSGNAEQYQMRWTLDTTMRCQSAPP